MDDSSGILKSVVIATSGYPIYLARTLMQLGYEPVKSDQYGRLPNLFSYTSYIAEAKGYSSLYTGFGFFLPAMVLKHAINDLALPQSNPRRGNSKPIDPSEIFAACLRESAVKIYSTLATYPLLTLTVSCISTALLGAEEPVEYNLQYLYKGIMPKLIFEVTMVFVSIVSKRLTAGLLDDELGYAVISRVPPFIISSFMYPFAVVSTVMADNGRSGLNPKFDDWNKCYKYLQLTNQLKRGSATFFRKEFGATALKSYRLLPFY